MCLHIHMPILYTCMYIYIYKYTYWQYGHIYIYIYGHIYIYNDSGALFSPLSKKLHRQLVCSQLLATSIIPSSSKGLLGGVGKKILAGTFAPIFQFSRTRKENRKKICNIKDLLTRCSGDLLQVQECCGLLRLYFHHSLAQPTSLSPTEFTVFCDLQMPCVSSDLSEPTSKAHAESLKNEVWKFALFVPIT